MVLSFREREGAENVEAVERGADDDPRDLGVPVHLLDVLLTLVHEQQLRRHVLEQVRLALRSLVLVQLDREIPQRDLVVRARGGKARVFCRMPLDGRDRRGVPVERGDGRRGGRLSASRASVRAQQQQATTYPLNDRRSQTLIAPSSPPEARR